MIVIFFLRTVSHEKTRESAHADAGSGVSQMPARYASRPKSASGAVSYTHLTLPTN